MFPNFFTCCSLLETSRKKKKNMVITHRDQNLEKVKLEVDPQLLYFHVKPMGSRKQTELSLRSEMVKPRTKGRMASSGRNRSSGDLADYRGTRDQEAYKTHDEDEEEEEEMGMEFVIMTEVFNAVSAMTIAYVSLQEAHNPWDPEKLRAADVAVVGELRRLGDLRERYLRRRCYGGGSGDMLREAVVPYEAAIEELKKEVKARDMEVDNLKEKLKSIIGEANSGKKSRNSMSRRKVHCITQVSTAPAPELFEGAMSGVREASDTFTIVLLSLMRAAHWDIAAVVRSIEAATATATRISASSVIQTQRANAKFALQSYISRKVFQGFDHESFYMDNGLSSVLSPDQYRRDCFAEYCDIKSMDSTELLNIQPSCNFGKFCSNKYLAIVHPKMEESFFGDLEQRQQVVEGRNPRSQFYRQFLELAKAMWLLHLLAFSLDPAPSQFEARRGADFHPDYMESVLKSPGQVPSGQVVGFPLIPGFKLGNGSIIKARVYLVSKN
ncbi:protein GRAVITROPIC IN THE LIGHT 1-like [Rosa rugosa]|uniref:protein GRAVITROPIC IN THE LIGHT 1-like n=1 Tax=Rosa rugosa TaxID=74645 RepID=UPI002B411FBD|nr:protein GRAVITROPIC IN THE LIGHT 1-like [Rosa rugosa]